MESNERLDRIEAGEIIVYAIVADDTRGDVLLREATELNDESWLLATFDGAGHFAPNVTRLETTGIPDLGGEGVLLADGSRLFAWRILNRDASGMGVSTATHGALLDPLSGLVQSLPPTDEEVADRSDRYGFDVAADEGGALSFVRGTADAVVLVREGHDDVRLPGIPVDDIHVVAFGSRTIVAWSQRGEGRNVMTKVVSVDADGTVLHDATVFDSEITRDSLATTLIVHDGEIWVARFEPIPDALVEGRIRVARLGEDLRRIDPDRALDGWGGFAPDAFSIVSWRGRVWLATVTLDVRYGLYSVVHVAPMPETGCIASVDVPLAVLAEPLAPGRRGFALTTTPENLLIARTADSAAPGVGLDLYRLRECR